MSGLAERFETLAPSTAAATGLAGALLVVFAGNYSVPAGQNGGLWPAVITGVACVLLDGCLFALVLPRVRNADRSALALGIITVLSLAVFWSGVTPVLAAATLATGAPGRTPSRTTVVRAVATFAAAAAIVVTLATSHLG